MAETYRVQATALNLREAPGDGAVITALPMGHFVDRIESADVPTGWWKVATIDKMTDIEGFVAHRFLRPFPPEQGADTMTAAGIVRVTRPRLDRLTPNGLDDILAPIARAADSVLRSFDINRSVLRLTHFLAQAAHESAGLRRLSENLNYSADGLRRVFRRHFADDAERADYARQPERIANRVYGARLGNGPEESGDGWRFRGRGIFQLTGRDNYRRFGERVGLDLEAQPELAADPQSSLRIAGSYWVSRDLNTHADADDLEEITRRINGGQHGLEDRRQYLQTARSIWG